MGDKKFWAQAPIYIVICVLLGFVIALLGAQNVVLKNQLDVTRGQLEEVKTAQKESKERGDRIEQNTDRVINYLRCVSLTPVGERTEDLINKCLSQDLPAQQPNGSSSGGTSFLEPAPSQGQPNGPIADGGQPVDNSPTPGQNNPNPGGQNPDPETPGRTGILAPITNPLCTNLTPRVCATLGL